VNFNNRYPNAQPGVYRLRPLASIAASLALTAAANLGMHYALADEHHDLHITAREAVSPNSDVPISQPVQESYEETFGPYYMPYAPEFAASKSATAVSPADVGDVVNRLHHAQANHEQNVHLEVIGMASDDAGPLPGRKDAMHGIGETNDRNQTLAGVRGQALAVRLGVALQKAHITGVETWVMTGEEQVLPKDKVANLKEMAGKYALSLDAMVTAYNTSQQLPSEAQQMLNTYLASNRGVRVEIHGSRPGVTPAGPIRTFEAPKVEAQPAQDVPKPFDQTPDDFLLPVVVATRRRTVAHPASVWDVAAEDLAHTLEKQKAPH
jgi:hypothetical protein